MKMQARKRRAKAPDMVERAIRVFNGGDRRGGETLAKKALKRDPGNPDALHILGMAAYTRSDLERAETLISRALSRRPDSGPYHYSMGLVNVARQRYDKAEEELRKAYQQMPEESRILSALGEALKMQGKYLEAYGCYRTLHRNGHSSGNIRWSLVSCLRHIRLSGYSEELEKDVLEYLYFNDVEHNELSRLIAWLLISKYRFEKGFEDTDIDTLSRDPLLLGALRRIYFTHPVIEGLLTHMRRHLLYESLAASLLEDRYLALAAGLALQSANNEYLLPFDSREKEILQGLQDVLAHQVSREDFPPDEIAGILLLLAMYMPLDALSFADRIAACPKGAWPGPILPVIERCLLEVIDEMQRAERIPSLVPITDPVSLAVQEQYEQNPYPRWLSLNVLDAVSYQQDLQNNLPGFRAPRFLDGAGLRVLVAGCGTGRQALQAASMYRDSTVLAVDISRRSLAYAQKMAQRYAIRNIEFVQADILDLDNLGRDFHVIQCSGVLHHMDDPMAGWTVLRRLLVPRGVMKIGLYSERARQNIAKAREMIRELGLRPTPEDMKRFRKAVINGELDKELMRLSRSTDFYVMSGLRDLLFHVQEHRFTPAQIKDLCHRLDLQFLGFVNLPPQTREAYKEMFPQDHRMANLSNWQDFEGLYPITFANMYNFWCHGA